VQQLKAQIEESRKNHENMIQAIESRAKDNSEGKVVA
jgi:hypothetical protein